MAAKASSKACDFDFMFYNMCYQQLDEEFCSQDQTGGEEGRKAAQADVFKDDFSSDEEEKKEEKNKIKRVGNEYEKLLNACFENELESDITKKNKNPDS